MRAFIASALLTSTVAIVACSDKSPVVHKGMDEGEVRQQLGEPTRASEDLAPPSMYAPRDSTCNVTAKRVLAYERWSGTTFLIYIDGAKKVVCTETTVITRSH